MVWFKLIKPIFIVNNFVRDFFHGSINEMVERLTDAEVTSFKEIGNLLDRC